MKKIAAKKRSCSVGLIHFKNYIKIYAGQWLSVNVGNIKYINTGIKY